jgi:hypothetical protein
MRDSEACTDPDNWQSRARRVVLRFLRSGSSRNVILELHRVWLGEEMGIGRVLKTIESIVVHACRIEIC